MTRQTPTVKPSTPHKQTRAELDAITRHELIEAIGSNQPRARKRYGEHYDAFERVVARLTATHPQVVAERLDMIHAAASHGTVLFVIQHGTDPVRIAGTFMTALTAADDKDNCALLFVGGPVPITHSSAGCGKQHTTETMGMPTVAQLAHAFRSDYRGISNCVDWDHMVAINPAPTSPGQISRAIADTALDFGAQTVVVIDNIERIPTTMLGIGRAFHTLQTARRENGKLIISSPSSQRLATQCVGMSFAIGASPNSPWDGAIELGHIESTPAISAFDDINPNGALVKKYGNGVQIGSRGLIEQLYTATYGDQATTDDGVMAFEPAQNGTHCTFLRAELSSTPQMA